MINNAIFWKCVTRPSRCVYINCFNRPRFPAEVSTKLQKCTFLDNLRTITQDGNKKLEKWPIFSSTFSNLFVIFISEFENTQNSFSRCFLGGSFSNRNNVRASVQFRRQSQPQHLKRWYLKNRPIHFHINSTRVIKQVKPNQLRSISMKSIEINKPLPAPIHSA